VCVCGGAWRWLSVTLVVVWVGGGVPDSGTTAREVNKLAALGASTIPLWDGGSSDYWPTPAIHFVSNPQAYRAPTSQEKLHRCSALDNQFLPRLASQPTDAQLLLGQRAFPSFQGGRALGLCASMSPPHPGDGVGACPVLGIQRNYLCCLGAMWEASATRACGLLGTPPTVPPNLDRPPCPMYCVNEVP